MCRRGKLQEKFGKWGQAFKTDKKKKDSASKQALIYLNIILYANFFDDSAISFKCRCGIFL